MRLDSVSETTLEQRARKNGNSIDGQWIMKNEGDGKTWLGGEIVLAALDDDILDQTKKARQEIISNDVGNSLGSVKESIEKSVKMGGMNY